jgi:hypothetical protein
MRKDQLIVTGGAIAFMAALGLFAVMGPKGKEAGVAASDSRQGTPAQALPTQGAIGASPEAINAGAALPAQIQPPRRSARIQVSEGHWQGMEAMELTTELKRKLNLAASMQGLLIDEVTMQSADSGLMAGDIMIGVGDRPVLTLRDFSDASKRVMNRNSVLITVIRGGRVKTFMLRTRGPLGFAQLETAPMILPGEITPHPYRGPCDKCHAIGTTGHLVPDPGEVTLPPPTVQANARSPHQDRGPCAKCHKIIY